MWGLILLAVLWNWVKVENELTLSSSPRRQIQAPCTAYSGVPVEALLHLTKIQISVIKTTVKYDYMNTNESHAFYFQQYRQIHVSLLPPAQSQSPITTFTTTAKAKSSKWPVAPQLNRLLYHCRHHQGICGETEEQGMEGGQRWGPSSVYLQGLYDQRDLSAELAVKPSESQEGRQRERENKSFVSFY